MWSRASPSRNEQRRNENTLQSLPASGGYSRNITSRSDFLNRHGLRVSIARDKAIQVPFSSPPQREEPRGDQPRGSSKLCSTHCRKATTLWAVFHTLLA
jgi:hypothetical protein